MEKATSFKIEIDKEECLACGACMDMCSLIEADEEGYAEAVTAKEIISFDGKDYAKAIDAEVICPVHAINVIEKG